MGFAYRVKRKNRGWLSPNGRTPSPEVVVLCLVAYESRHQFEASKARTGNHCWHLWPATWLRKRNITSKLSCFGKQKDSFSPFWQGKSSHCKINLRNMNRKGFSHFLYTPDLETAHVDLFWLKEHFVSVFRNE